MKRLSRDASASVRGDAFEGCESIETWGDQERLVLWRKWAGLVGLIERLGRASDTGGKKSAATVRYRRDGVTGW